MLERLRKNRLSRSRAFRCFCAELLGTYLLVALVLGAGANSAISGKDGERQAPAVMATIGGGLGVAIGLYVSFGVSGGQCNPVVTVSLFSLGHISLVDLFLYQAAQYLGGFLAACTVYARYSSLFDLLDGGQRTAFGQNGTASVFVTMPHPQVSIGRAVADQLFTSAAFIMLLLSVVDPRNVKVPRYLQPLLIGLGVMGIVQCSHLVSGATLNTARDFSPRVLAYMVGYGGEVFSARGFAFWVPLLVPYLGGVLGAWIYEIFIGWSLSCIHEAEESENKNREEPMNGNAEADRLVNGEEQKQQEV